jgi:methylmalonyl-CoA mutase N-terminal domain/subunit
MGGGLTADQPLNNITRSTVYALAAILAGTRSMNLACFDEVYYSFDLAIRTTLRTQHPGVRNGSGRCRGPRFLHGKPHE